MRKGGGRQRKEEEERGRRRKKEEGGGGETMNIHEIIMDIQLLLELSWFKNVDKVICEEEETIAFRSRTFGVDSTLMATTTVTASVFISLPLLDNSLHGKY
ncbi:hypothetical protein C0Q70_08294 [Pomacea canaliculata]|uniref:Uncharacterized protein n=1 Tax=Pomacea canaliculata TaxID=400727 RepID=A0A2T7PHG3_POMCA|nr:hypothetical protein C0Q70_08294 [Pomacea canaliculata]